MAVQRCTGCGVVLQRSKPKSSGYIEDVKSAWYEKKQPEKVAKSPEAQNLMQKLRAIGTPDDVLRELHRQQSGE